MKVTVKLTKKWKKKCMKCVEKSKNSRIIILILSSSYPHKDRRSNTCVCVFLNYLLEIITTINGKFSDLYKK